MEKFQSLSDTEMKIMEVIWELGRSVMSNELLDIFSETEGKEWKGQTIATFLSRLVDKNLLSVKKKGRANVYKACLSYKEYKKWEAQSLLDTHYQGSVKNFLATLYDENVTDGELGEIQKWFSDK